MLDQVHSLLLYLNIFHLIRGVVLAAKVLFYEFNCLTELIRLCNVKHVK